MMLQHAKNASEQVRHQLKRLCLGHNSYDFVQQFSNFSLQLEES